MTFKWKNLSQAKHLTQNLEAKLAAAKVAAPSPLSSTGAQCTPQPQPGTSYGVSTHYATYTNSTLMVDDKTSVFALPRSRYDPMDLWAADHAAEVRAAAEDIRTDHDEDRRGNYRAAASRLWKDQPQNVRDEYLVRASTQKKDVQNLPTRFE